MATEHRGYSHLYRCRRALREGCDLWGEMNARCSEQDALVFGQMNELRSRMRVAETGLTMAEYFREETCKDVRSSLITFRFVRRRGRGLRSDGPDALRR